METNESKGLDALVEADVCEHFGEFSVMLSTSSGFRCIGVFYSRESAENLAEAWNERRAAVAELIEAARGVNALSIQSEMHMKLRAALARIGGAK